MSPGRFPLVAVALLALAGCATQAPYRTSPQINPPATTAPAATATPTTPNPSTNGARCVAGSGVVVRVGSDAHTATAMMQGGVLGGVLADDGKGAGSQAATPASGGHDIYVRMDDGRKLIVNQHDIGGIAAGTRVAIDASCRARVAR